MEAGSELLRERALCCSGLPGRKGAALSIDSPRSGEGSWSGDAAPGCLQGRWPAEGGRWGVEGRGAGSAAAPALAQRGAEAPALASFPGCWSEAAGGLEGWCGAEPCLGATEAPWPPSEILGHSRSMA